MNERIKQITGQVLDELVPETWVALGYDKIKEIQNRTAELIVQECAKVCDLYAMPDGTSETAIILASAIRRKFGVEE